ncbi:GNAT family N-acetyltransferase [Bacillus cereus]|uniref:GNAT family N-acetyltransferase n=1 Tax=Bacillus cereus group TaxID=86661 RepID=UPI000BFBE6D5|nr:MULTISPECIES: GNAT family N-acetyltransferase [Bacillus cereus group]PGS36714.1 GNAT family N-acetyltransferase [Bacillus cereus]PGU38248.1 GNAT family N-acetyltransferase [Bacillus cereus]
MIHKADSKMKKKLSTVFEGLDSVIIRSYLQGHMGTAWVNNLEKPTVAQIIVGIFAFYAGDPNATETEELLHNLPEDILVIVNTDEWKERIETAHKGSFDKFQRFRFKKNPANLNSNYLKTMLSKLPEEYELKKIDANIAGDPSLHAISEDFTGQFDSIEDYLNRGVGFAILYHGKVVCGASSYSIYDEGIEIEVGTHRDHRRKGLATVASSALILDCLAKGKYPNWDAANLESAELAKSLGYVYEEAYDTYYINNRK